MHSGRSGYYILSNSKYIPDMRETKTTRMHCIYSEPGKVSTLMVLFSAVLIFTLFFFFLLFFNKRSFSQGFKMLQYNLYVII